MTQDATANPTDKDQKEGSLARVRSRLHEISKEIDLIEIDKQKSSSFTSYSRQDLSAEMLEERRMSTETPMPGFDAALARHFNPQTIAAIYETLARLQLPAPMADIEFLAGTEGVLLFSNRYGMTLRIERPDADIRLGETQLGRIDDNPWILQPIASITAGGAVMEICPGVHTTDNSGDSRTLESELAATGADFYDCGTCNAGRLPVATPLFPSGIPVVIDRLAVRKLSQTPTDIARALARMGTDACPQALLYKELRDAFAAAWPEGAPAPDPAAIKVFWKMMQMHRGHGLLVAGWNEKISDDYKITTARIAAAAYDQRLTQAFKQAKKMKKRQAAARPAKASPILR